MSVNGNYSGNLQQPVSQNLAGGTLTDIGTAAADSTLFLSSFIFANDTAGSVVCYLYWYEAATTTDHMIWVGTVATKDSKITSDIPIRLRAGDKIKAQGAANVRVSLIYMLSFALNQPQ